MRKLFLVLWCSVLSGQVVFNNTNTMGYAAATSLSVSQSVTAGASNLAAFACVEFGGAAGGTVTGVTYGGQTMTAVGTAAWNAPGYFGTQLFYLAAPPTGSNMLAVTISGGNEIHANLVSFSGVNQSTPVRSGSPQTTVVSAQNPSLTITSNANDLTMSCLGSARDSNNHTNQTQVGYSAGGFYYAADDRATSPGATVVHTWSMDISSLVAMSGFSIKAQLAPKKKVIVVQ
jgi:hypothetical protein